MGRCWSKNINLQILGYGNQIYRLGAVIITQCCILVVLHTCVAKRIKLKHLTTYTDENELCEMMNSLVNMTVVIIFQSMHMANHNVILFNYALSY